MPRKDFQAHLEEARGGVLPKNVSSIVPGSDDGTFVILYQTSDLQEIRIQAQTSDVGDYPRSHTFFIFTDSIDVPASVSAALRDISILCELTVSQTIREICVKLDHVVERQTSGDEDAEMEEAFSDPDSFDDGFCPIDDEDINDEGYFRNTQPLEGCGHMNNDRSQSHSSNQEELLKTLVQDVSIARKAGFRVSHYGDIRSPGEKCYLMISIRVAKLGIQDDTRQAWNLHQEEYIMLVIKYKYGYRGLKDLKDSNTGQKYLTTNLLITSKHKLSFSELTSALENSKSGASENDITTTVDATSPPSRSLFIGSALNELLNTRLLTLIWYRLAGSLNWTAAMQFHNDQRGASSARVKSIASYEITEDTSRIEGIPDVVKADHIRDAMSTDPKVISLPCAAMQFALRHIVRCTEFCLVCFAKTEEDNFEALKPYVCSKPLCLYQYMSMGLGPGIEFEVLSQPHVVDLLISFCYSGAAGYTLREMPLGLGVLIPDPAVLPRYSSMAMATRSTYNVGYQTANSTFISVPPPSGTLTMKASWNVALRELRLPLEYNLELKKSLPHRMFIVGDWIAFWTVEAQIYHCKITEIQHPVYRFEHAISARDKEEPQSLKARVGSSKTKQSQDDTAANRVLVVHVVAHNRQFDEIDEYYKPAAICLLLDTLPSVPEMAEFLRGERSLRRKLSDYKAKVIPAALAILRWIVASNRSCLVYTGDNPQEELIQGMTGYVQFRFASGAPDKESRFLKNVTSVQARLNTAHPTIFAWHGSPVKNWHSILREGLNIKTLANGRAFGNGVYHAKDANTSTSYAVTSHKNWPASKLDIKQVLSLNEIVNAPAEFTSCSPYLVVQHLDWLQTRYLFVKSDNKELITDQHSTPEFILPQDEKYCPRGLQNPLVIPTCAISKSRRKAMVLDQNRAQNPLSKSALATHSEDIPVYLSENSDDEDAILSTRPPVVSSGKTMGKTAAGMTIAKSSNLTDFESGSLDRSNLPLLAAPEFSSPSSSQNLQREIKAMLKEQSETPLHELGWFLDGEHIENPYQWIVELHSFDKSLPLAKDMESQKISSIVLELRFGPNFNFSPPFIRIIRPRFLPFMQGGGGHVTAGGALCMELLTSSGWNATCTISSVLLQVRLALSSLDPQPARLQQSRDKQAQSQYEIGEAIDAFRRACYTHGWKIPDDFKEITSMGSVSGCGKTVS